MLSLPRSIFMLLLNLPLLAGSGCDQVRQTDQESAGHASSEYVDTYSFAGEAPEPVAGVTLQFLGRHRHGQFGKSAAEICAYDVASKRLFVANGSVEAVDILDLSDPSLPRLLKQVSLKSIGSAVNSVAVREGLIAVAVSAIPKQAPGFVVLLNIEGEILKRLPVGSEPDMVTFSPDGRWILTADEGEPTDDYSHDPEGSVSLIDLSGGVEGLSEASVTRLGFGKYNDRSLLDPQVRVFGPGASVAQDLEPEYIAVAPDSKTAWVALQEANAFAIIDLEQPEITQIVALGFKDHSLPENAFDASDKGGKIDIRPWPVKGMYQPDAIAAFTLDGETFVVSANEGDHRGFAAFDESVRVADLKLNPEVFPNAAELQQDDQLGRLTVTNTLGDTNGDGQYEELYCLGGRSFAVWSAAGELVFDSGSQFERIIADRFPDSFNCDSEGNKKKNRSDNKGPEPEGLVVGEIDGSLYLFIGMERHSGIMIYSLENPREPQFVDYVSTRDYTHPPETEQAGDVAPEGMIFISAQNSPNGKPLLVVNYEMSGTTAIYEVVPTSE